MKDTQAPPKVSEKVQVGVSLPTDLLREIDQIAADQDRPRASVIRMLLNEVVKNKRLQTA